MQSPRSPTLQESDTDLPELTSSGHEQPEEVSQLEGLATRMFFDCGNNIACKFSSMQILLLKSYLDFKLNYAAFRMPMLLTYNHGARIFISVHRPCN